MADEKVGLVVKVKVHGEQQLRKLKREINGLNDHVTLLKNRVTSNLDSMDAKWKKHFDGVDKMVKMMGGALTKFVGMSAKFAAGQLAAMGAAMMVVHGAFILGNASMKAFRYISKGVAAGLASITVAAGTAAAAIRENQAAMFAYKKLGKNEFGSGMNQVRQEMRAMARDTDLAGLSAKDLNSIYSEISKKGTYTQSSQALVKSLMDFGAAGQDVAQGAQAVGALVGMLQDPKATFAQITASAKDLGPAMENALKEAKTKGIDTVAELKGAILDGTLSVIGGVNGQFAAVNDTLIGRFKKAMNIIKADFADFGQVFLAPAKDALGKIEHTIRRTLIQVTGTLTTFGKGSMMDGLTSGFEKLADGFAKMINNYVPKAEGMLKGISSWWSDFRNGWNDVLDRTRPFIDAARVIEDMIKNALQPLFSEFGSAMDNTRNLILNNKQAFEEFGTRVGAFITEFGRFAGATREIFVQAMPFINDMVEGATKLFHIFNDVLGAVRQIAGVDSPAGAFGLAGALMAGGRGMKKTIGGVVPDFAKMQKTQLMNVNAGVVNVDGPGGGMSSKTGGGGGGIAGAGGRSLTMPSGKTFPMAPNQLQAGSGLYGAGHPMSPLRQQGMRSQVGIDNTGGGAPTGTGVTPAGGREIAPGYVTGPHNKGIYETASGRKLTMRDGGWWKAMATPNTPGYAQSVDGVDPSRYKKFMGKYGPRAQRTTEAYARFAGDEAKGIKGFNNRASTGIGATLGLGLLSSIAPESAKGALALGSGVAMFNPGAGVAIGGLGAAATSTSSGFGAASGAMGGFAAGMMTGSVPFAIIGAVMGAIAGGIMGAVNKRKEEYKLARAAGAAMASNVQSGMLSGISSSLGSVVGQGAGVTRRVAKQQLDTLVSTNQQNVNDITGFIAQGPDALKAEMARGYNEQSGVFANIPYDKYQDALNRPQAFAEETLREMNKDLSASRSIQTIYDSRMKQYEQLFGMTEDQVFGLAQSTGLNLMEVTQSLDSAISQLVSGMISSTSSLNAFIGETYASMYDVVDTAKKASEAPKIYDEAARTIFDKNAAGTLTSPDIMDFLKTALQQFPAMYGSSPGGQTRGLIEFGNQFLNENGLAYQYGPNGEKYPLSGMGGTFFNQENKPIMDELRGIQQASLGRAGRELLTTSLTTMGLQLSDPSLASGFGGQLNALAQTDPEAATNVVNTLAKFQDYFAVATTEEQQSAVTSGLDSYLKETFNTLFTGDWATTVFKPLEDTAAATSTAVYKGITDAFAPGFNLSANSVSVAAAQSALVTSPSVTVVQNVAPKDTKFPKSNSVGDTGTNLSKTLDAHQRLNTGAGNRFITSSYRNYSLGSSNSDHINGRAYDLVGDNLISYRDAVQRDGGFAQFHGDTQNRHLHVVPRIGDSMSPAYAMATGAASVTGSQSSGSPVYNITVNGAGSNPEEIANIVMHKIKINEKISKERAY